MDSWSPIRDQRSGSQALSHSPSFSSKASNASDGDHPRRKAEPGYSFVGMHYIFDQCKAMVTVVKFGQMSSDLLAYGASDGTLTGACDWDDRGKMFIEVEGILRRQIKMSVIPSVQPFHAIAYPLDPMLALEISRKYAAHCFVTAARYSLPPFNHPAPLPIRGGNGRLRVGMKEYEEKAVSLALNRLKASRLTCPLFDTARWVRNLDRAYFRMWNLYCSGQHPQPFKVTENDSEFP